MAIENIEAINAALLLGDRPAFPPGTTFIWGAFQGVIGRAGYDPLDDTYMVIWDGPVHRKDWMPWVEDAGTRMEGNPWMEFFHPAFGYRRIMELKRRVSAELFHVTPPRITQVPVFPPFEEWERGPRYTMRVPEGRGDPVVKL